MRAVGRSPQAAADARRKTDVRLGGDHHILVLNAGSSSLKYRLIEPRTGESLARGIVERLHTDEAVLRHRSGSGDQHVMACPRVDVAGAVDAMMTTFADHGPGIGAVSAVGHRVVHGGPDFVSAVIVDDTVIARIRALIPLAPLHNPANLTGIEVMRRNLPDVPHVAVFDTSFHSGLPAAARTYPLPSALTRAWPIRRYGFHGSSIGFVSTVVAQLLGRDLDDLGLIVCHLGNGASVTAVDGGRSVDTSMGFTPLEGLMMGTRVGDLDASVPLFLQREAGLSIEEVENILEHESGLLGLAGVSDMRDVRRRADDGNADAELALGIYRHRLRRYIGSLAVLPRTDALVFTGGIGQNDTRLRAEVCQSLPHLGISIDPTANARATGDGDPEFVDDGPAPVRVVVAPTNEELQIARLTDATATTLPNSLSQPRGPPMTLTTSDTTSTTDLAPPPTTRSRRWTPGGGRTTT